MRLPQRREFRTCPHTHKDFIATVGGLPNQESSPVISISRGGENTPSTLKGLCGDPYICSCLSPLPQSCGVLSLTIYCSDDAAARRKEGGKPFFRLHDFSKSGKNYSRKGGAGLRRRRLRAGGDEICARDEIPLSNSVPTQWSLRDLLPPPPPPLVMQFRKREDVITEGRNPSNSAPRSSLFHCGHGGWRECWFSSPPTFDCD